LHIKFDDFSTLCHLTISNHHNIRTLANTKDCGAQHTPVGCVHVPPTATISQTLILGFELAQMRIQNQNIYLIFQNLLLDGVSTLTT
jgi:hypothetical protein